MQENAIELLGFSDSDSAGDIGDRDYEGPIRFLHADENTDDFRSSRWLPTHFISNGLDNVRDGKPSEAQSGAKNTGQMTEPGTVLRAWPRLRRGRDPCPATAGADSRFVHYGRGLVISQPFPSVPPKSCFGRH